MASRELTTPQASASPEASSKTVPASSQKALYPNLMSLEEMEERTARHEVAAVQRAMAVQARKAAE
jgi:hypothetical protein